MVQRSVRTSRSIPSSRRTSTLRQAASITVLLPASSQSRWVRRMLSGRRSTPTVPMVASATSNMPTPRMAAWLCSSAISLRMVASSRPQAWLLNSGISKVLPFASTRRRMLAKAFSVARSRKAIVLSSPTKDPRVDPVCRRCFTRHPTSSRCTWARNVPSSPTDVSRVALRAFPSDTSALRQQQVATSERSRMATSSSSTSRHVRSTSSSATKSWKHVHSSL